jgi:predicted alpha/beta hydrolase family esterase
MSGSNDKQQVFYIHGGTAFSRYEDFLHYLKTKEIRDLPGTGSFKKWSATFREDFGNEFEVFTPSMPNSQNAKYEEWKIWFERYFEFLHDGVILVGWSQGGYFLAKYLTERDTTFIIKALFLVAAPFDGTDLGGEDGGDFTFDTSRVGELAKKASKIYLFHSKDDFLVPYNHALKYKEALPEAELVTFEDKNHFLVEKFPELLARIKQLSIDSI